MPLRAGMRSEHRLGSYPKIIRHPPTPPTPYPLKISFYYFLCDSVFKSSIELLQSFFLILLEPGRWANLSLNQSEDLKTRPHDGTQRVRALGAVPSQPCYYCSWSFSGPGPGLFWFLTIFQVVEGVKTNLLFFGDCKRESPSQPLISSASPPEP